jgi:hypothetical protein
MGPQSFNVLPQAVAASRRSGSSLSSCHRTAVSRSVRLGLSPVRATDGCRSRGEAHARAEQATGKSCGEAAALLPWGEAVAEASRRSGLSRLPPSGIQARPKTNFLLPSSRAGAFGFATSACGTGVPPVATSSLRLSVSPSLRLSVSPSLRLSVSPSLRLSVTPSLLLLRAQKRHPAHPLRTILTKFVNPCASNTNAQTLSPYIPHWCARQ